VSLLRLVTCGIGLLLVCAFSAMATPSKKDSGNECGAVVTATDVRPDTDGRHWYFTFDITAGNASDTATSTGGYLYDYTYIDGSNRPNPVVGAQGLGWAPGDGHHFTQPNTQDVPNATSISVSTVRVHDVTSSACYTSRAKNVK
jgi:hypothetical protein